MIALIEVAYVNCH